eukprot:scaffold145968_cov16-Prasinocladus_malaysianus.AAC.1
MNCLWPTVTKSTAKMLNLQQALLLNYEKENLHHQNLYDNAYTPSFADWASKYAIIYTSEMHLFKTDHQATDVPWEA